MAFYVNAASQFERALRALIILQGAADTNWDNTFISNDSRKRILPNKTFVVTAVTPIKPHRPESICYCEIQHHFSAPDQPSQQPNSQSVSMGNFVGDTIDTLNLASGQGLEALADAITAAGRWLAQQDGTAAGDKIAADNADMVNFRCDEVVFSTPFITRGKEQDSTNWVEILHIQARTSSSAVALPN